MSNVRQSNIDGIVRGTSKNPKLKTLHRVATGLSMTISEFLYFSELDEVTFEDND